MREAGESERGEEGAKQGRRGRMRLWGRMLFPVTASLLGLVSLRLLGPDVVSQQELSSFIRPLGAFAPLVFVLLLTVRPVTLLPGQLFAAVGGILFGTVLGSVYALLGSFLAAYLVFFLARRLGTRFMRRLAGGRYEALRKTARRHDFSFGLLSCINPLVPTDVMIAVAGASGARFWPTTLGVLLGTVPGTILTVQFGSALSQGKTLLTVLSAVGLVLSLVAGVGLGRKAYREVMGDGSPEDEETPSSGPRASPERTQEQHERRPPRPKLVQPATAATPLPESPSAPT